jgi:integrase
MATLFVHLILDQAVGDRMSNRKCGPRVHGRDLDELAVQSADLLGTGPVRRGLQCRRPRKRPSDCALCRVDRSLRLLRIGAIKLAAEDTKTDFARTVYLTSRVVQVLKLLPRRLGTDYVFVNPETGTRWEDARKLFVRDRRRVGLEHLWFHDLRRSFVTNARRRGVPESVVMRMSGHRTRNVFDRYNIVEDEDVRNAVKVIEAATARKLW